MALNVVKDVIDGKHIYMDALIEKAKKVLDKELLKKVKYEDIEKTVKWVIDEIIFSQITK